MNGTYHPGRDEPILAGSSALTFLPAQVFKCPSPHPWKQVALFPEPAMKGDPGKSFLLHLSTLVCLPPELFVFAEWTWPSVTVTQLWKRDAFISPPHATLYCSGDTSRKKKRQKATTNGIGDEKGEAKLPFLTRFRYELHKRPRKMCGDISATLIRLPAHCVPPRAHFFCWRVCFFFSLFKMCFFLKSLTWQET